MKRLAPPLVVLLSVVFIWETAAKNQFLNTALFPAPSKVLATLGELRGDFFNATSETFLNVLFGLGLSLFAGSLLAFLFSLSIISRRAILPFAIFFQTVPIIAVAPLLVIYFGFGAPTVVASSFIVSIFPIIANTLIGLASATPAKQDLFAIYEASKLQILFKLRLPSAYPYIYSGVKIAAGLSIVGAIAGEFVGGGGLGSMIDSARTQQRIDIVFAALLLLSLMGYFFIAVLEVSNRFILQRRPFVLATLE